MKKVLFGILGLLFIVALGLTFKTTNVGGLLAGDNFINKYNETSGAVLLDVRTPLEFNTSHISDAVNIDYENISFKNEVKKLDKTKTYFVYCRSGNRSAKAITVMKNEGIKNIYELRGGISTYPELLE
jgi:rhodanese-related sulfurtransferase